MPPRWASSVAALAAAAALAGCTGGAADGPGPVDAATELAEALTSGDLDRVAWADTPDPQAWWDELTEGMGEVTPTVRVADVAEVAEPAEPADGRAATATATLSWSWPLTEQDAWAYETTAELVEGDAGWEVRPEPSLVAPTIDDGDVLRLTATEPPRGDILGAGGVRLVRGRPVFRVGLDKTQVGPARQLRSARRLARLVDVEPAGLVEQVRVTGDEAFVEAIVLRAHDLTPRIRAGVAVIPGARALPGSLPLAPFREFARPILGTVGPVTAEIVEESGGRYAAGDVAGLSGLQQRYDEQLRGTPGRSVIAVYNGQPRELFAVDPVPGDPLRTTLDLRLQTVAERLLVGLRPAAALVAVRPSDGAVLAAASGPGGGGYSTATLGQYAPGSTFKVVSSLALLRTGLRPGDPVRCPPAVVVDGKRFENYSDYPPSDLGTVDLRTAVASSCNTAFVGQRGRVPHADLASAAASLGLGVDHDLGFAVYLGSVPARAESATDHAASMIGQGRVLASPVAMAAVVASVAHGDTVVPTLLPDVADATADPGRPLTPSEAARLRDLMRGVVLRGSGVALADVPGPPVLAKTGTAEFGQARPPRTHAWMVAAQGDLAVAVFVDVGESGSRTAGPILEAFLRAAR
jgi:cell division protein FtsI/penicillin-binding protein 2